MPEMQFHIRWPDGASEACYSPSLVVKDYLEPGQTYPLDDFVRRTKTALTVASDRVKIKYGMACSRALSQLARIEQTAARFAELPDARVTIESLKE